MKKFLFNNNSHTFQTEKHRKKHQLRVWIISIVSVVLVFGSVSLFILLKNYNYNITNIVGESTTEVTEDASTKAPPVATGSADILLTLHDDNNNLKFACIVKANAETKNISVCSLDLNSSSGKELVKEFKAADKDLMLTEFKTTVSKMSGISIDRYINADYNQFTRTISVMGSVTMKIPEDISYNKDDIVLSLKKGEWKLIGANLLNYLIISDRSTQNDIITAVLQEYITRKNFENGEKIYQKLVNILDTDITAFDFNSALPALEAISYAEGKLSFTTFTMKG